MMDILGWLPPPPTDLRALFRRLEELPPDDAGLAVERLAQYRLDSNQLYRFGKVISSIRSRRGDLNPLIPFRLGLLSNGTTSLLAPVLMGSAARHGISLDVVETPFDQAVQQVLDAESTLNRAHPDAILLALDHRGLPLRPCPGDDERAQATCAEAISHLDMLRQGVHSGCGATVILATLATPPEALFGNLDVRVPGTWRDLVRRFNLGLVDLVRGSSDLILDVERIAGVIGANRWHDPTQWNLAKLGFAQAFVPVWGEEVGRLLAALRGRARKCLVLDLDNTLWGGVVGDDGLLGITLGNGDPVGEAYLEVQRAALALRERGIVLAVCSKNEDAVAREVFRRHPEMLVKEEHIAVFQANWQDKATNLRVIAETLDLGIDALVLLDDNPCERDQVRQELPSVAVPELPDDPALYARTLLSAGYFEAIAFSADDKRRAGAYRENALRVELAGRCAHLDGYLESLHMEMQISPFDAMGRSRITQLINKTNQFNLTTRRYTEAQIQAFAEDQAYFAMQVRLQDRFGDNGMISVILCSLTEGNWLIDLWLMSCRVLNRRVEHAVLNEIVARALERDIPRLRGTYIPSARNELVRDHYAKLGFTFAGQEAGGTHWELDTRSYRPHAVPCHVTSLF